MNIHTILCDQVQLLLSLLNTARQTLLKRTWNLCKLNRVHTQARNCLGAIKAKLRKKKLFKCWEGSGVFASHVPIEKEHRPVEIISYPQGHNGHHRCNDLIGFLSFFQNQNNETTATTTTKQGHFFFRFTTKHFKCSECLWTMIVGRISKCTLTITP